MNMLQNIVRSRFGGAGSALPVTNVNTHDSNAKGPKLRIRTRAEAWWQMPFERTLLLALGLLAVMALLVNLSMPQAPQVNPKFLAQDNFENSGPTPIPQPLALNPLRLPLSFPRAPLYTTTPDGNTTRIPRILHVTFGLSEPDAIFGLTQYLSLISALHVLQPNQTLVHVLYAPTGLYWDLLQPHVTVVKHSPVTEIFGNPVTHYAHKADIIRLRALQEHGGIYMDLDVVFLRDITPLLRFDFVMGQEGENGRIGLCNAVILANKDSPFLQRWYNSYRSFDGSQWNYHSVQLPKLLAERHPADITILDYRAFFWPLWDAEGLREMYGGFTYDYAHNFAVHMWNSALMRSEFKDITQTKMITAPPSRLLQHLQIYAVDPLFAVVMPCYNQRQYIRESMESVIHQVFTKWEIIVVDDSSPDKCGDFVMSELVAGPFQAWKDRIRVVYNTVNKGLAESRNVGISHAVAPWICPLDADDLISTAYFAAAEAAVTENPNVELIYANQQFFGSGSDEWLWDVKSFDVLSAMSSGPLPVMTLYRKSLWLDVGGYRSVMPWGNEDYDLWLRVALRGVSHHKLPAAVRSLYRFKADSMMRTAERYKTEERAMLRVMHPLVFPAPAVLAAIEDVGRMGPETAARIQAKRNYTHLSEEDTMFMHLCLAIRADWHHEPWADVEAGYQHAHAYYHRQLSNVSAAAGRWIVLFLRGRHACRAAQLTKSRAKSGIEWLDEAAQLQPALLLHRTFQRARRLCTVVANTTND